MSGLVRIVLAVAALALVTGCFMPLPPDDPVAFGHARWCGGNPPSGYCIVGEPH